MACEDVEPRGSFDVGYTRRDATPIVLAFTAEDRARFDRIEGLLVELIAGLKARGSL